MGSETKSLSGRRALIVEDEALVTMALQDMLEDMGCVIAGSASRFDEAMVKASSLAFDFAVLDVNLHGRQTIPIAEALRDRGVAFIFASGYDPTSIPATLQSVPALQKPFYQRELERTIQALLDAGPTAGVHRH